MSNTRLLAVLAVVVIAAAGCAVKIGPGEHGWYEGSLWQGFNVEASASPPSICIGCLETEQDKSESVITPEAVVVTARPIVKQEPQPE